ncbi:FlgO family outer membrane protein [candidate division CSSED10-310 bacterium]|uniref:FlgO family outer membrane protein n=1 Tax=candidate division CSSED10-310 bacterium TaxID=2855610 RepID=A0ABV6Z349_UNCC1
MVCLTKIKVFFVLSWILSVIFAQPTTAKDKILAIVPVQSADTAPEYSYLGSELATTLFARLSQVTGVRLVERSYVAKIVEEQKLQQTAWSAKRTVTELGNLLGADYLIIVNYHIHEVDALVSARIVSVKNGEVIEATQAMGNAYYLRGLLSKAGTKVSEIVQKAFSSSAHPQAKKLHPQALEAFQKGSTLIGTSRQKTQEQINYYHQAIEIEPDFLEAHFNLANVYNSLKLYNKAALEYREVLRIDPNYLFALENLALLHGKIPMTRNEIISLWERALKLEKRLEKIDMIEKKLTALRNNEK